MELYQFFWLNQPKKHFKELFRYAENLTWVVEQSILPLPTRYCPCPPDTAPAHPFRRGPQYFSDFFFNKRVIHSAPRGAMWIT